MSSLLTIAEYGLREALRRKVFVVVLLLTVAFLTLYWLGVHFLYANLGNVGPPTGVDATTFVGATVFGLAMFGTLFLGTVLAVFLTLGVVRGDAERGLLQPLVVRPLGRTTLLFARWLGAAAVCAPYVGAVYLATMLITGLTGHWWPDHLVVPGVELAAAVALIAGISILGSVFLTSTANGIAVFMIFGAGLVAGLLGTIGYGLNSHGLERAAKVAAYIIPFEEQSLGANGGKTFSTVARYKRDVLTASYIGLMATDRHRTDAGGGSLAARLAKMSATERAAWAAEVAAQARALLEAPTIDHEDR